MKRTDFQDEIRPKIINYIETKPKRRCSCDRCGRYEEVPYIKKDIPQCTSEFILDWDWEGIHSSLIREDKLATHSSLFWLTAVTRDYIERWGRCRAVFSTESSFIGIDHRVKKQDSPTKSFKNASIQMIWV